MGLDLKKDAKKIRLFVLVSSILLIAALGLAAFRSLNPSWQRWQELFYKDQPTTHRRPLEIVQQKLCNGDVERCKTCHLGMTRSVASRSDIPKVFRSHPNDSFANLHINRGCSPCHGGVGRALDELHAHTLEDQDIKDPRMNQPHIQASCARCHTPGDKPGQQSLVRGALLYLRLGCNVCHPLKDGGLGGFDFGPDLKSMGRKSLSFLEASLIDPCANFAQSTMPSFRPTFENQTERLTDLIVYLQSLSHKPYPAECTNRNQQTIGYNSKCTNCHTATGGQTQGSFRHRCVYILDRSPELRCNRCHPGSLPPANKKNGLCPLIDQHMPSCQVCHQQNRI